MKLINDMVISELGSEYAAVPVGEAADKFHGIVRLNKTGRDIWLGLADGKSEEEIAADLVDRYDGVDMDRALTAVRTTINNLRNEGILTD